MSQSGDMLTITPGVLRRKKGRRGWENCSCGHIWLTVVSLSAKELNRNFVLPPSINKLARLFQIKDSLPWLVLHVGKCDEVTMETNRGFLAARKYDQVAMATASGVHSLPDYPAQGQVFQYFFDGYDLYIYTLRKCRVALFLADFAVRVAVSLEKIL